MSIHQIIDNLLQYPPQSEAAASAFLAKLTPEEQMRLIAAIYIGRDHLHCTEIRPDMLANGGLKRASIDHIAQSEYAQILFEKSSSLNTYLKTLVRCAEASGFDLESI